MAQLRLSLERSLGIGGRVAGVCPLALAGAVGTPGSRLTLRAANAFDLSVRIPELAFQNSRSKPPLLLVLLLMMMWLLLGRVGAISEFASLAPRTRIPEASRVWRTETVVEECSRILRANLRREQRPQRRLRRSRWQVGRLTWSLGVETVGVLKVFWKMISVATWQFGFWSVVRFAPTHSISL